MNKQNICPGFDLISYNTPGICNYLKYKISLIISSIFQTEFLTIILYKDLIYVLNGLDMMLFTHMFMYEKHVMWIGSS